MVPPYDMKFVYCAFQEAMRNDIPAEDASCDMLSQEASAVMSDTVNMLDEDLKENHTGFKGI